jgi:hypothetical protein
MKVDIHTIRRAVNECKQLNGEYIAYAFNNDDPIMLFRQIKQAIDSLKATSEETV